MTKSIIAIIGATEKPGTQWAQLFAKAGQRLVLVDSQTEKLSLLVQKIKTSFSEADIEMETCAKEASWEADIIILASASQNYQDMAEKIRSVSTGKIVISSTNITKAAYKGDNQKSAAEELQSLLPYARVVKTFNATMASDLAEQDIFIAGNNGDAVETVAQLIGTTGFHPVVVGDLSVSSKLESIILQLSSKHIKTSQVTE